MRSLDLNIQENGQAVISMDPDLAGILVNNLLNNAIKYAPPGTEIKISINKDEVRFSNSIDVSFEFSDQFHHFILKTKSYI
jgi:signal transduction histidine kinase